jgi:predicted sulfurtransferase
MYKLLVEHSRDYSTHVVSQGVLEFVEEQEGKAVTELTLIFDQNTQQELERFRKLAVKVYEKIVALDFPDTTDYPKTLDGIIQFEDDLIAGVV